MSDAPAFGHIKALPITLSGVTKSYDGAGVVIPKLDIRFNAAEFTVILGPSGCGKSTLLQMIAGLERVSDGAILFGEREVQTLEPKLRGCAMVFQNYALYPHMSVFDNIAYSLRISGVPKAERQARVNSVAEMLGLQPYLARRPGQLSGGQRQRVAIGRAIVREPSVLLFDEPLSNLDAQLRHDTRLELAALHKRIGATTVFVTHDQVEAMTLADRILVLNKGQVEQFDTPQAIYHRPASVFVAKFIGAPPMNIFPGRGDGHSIRLPTGHVLGSSVHSGEVLVGIRPEEVQLVARSPGQPSIEARILHREDLGSHQVLTLSLGGELTLRVATPFGRRTAGGATVEIVLPRDALHLFNANTGRRIEAAFSTTPQKELHV